MYITKKIDVDLGCTPYGVANCLLSSYTTTPNGQEIYLCLKCYVEREAPTHAKYVVPITHLYESIIIITSTLYTIIIFFTH